MKLSPRKFMGGGGDGGKGGDIVLKVSPHLYDLSKFKGNKKFIARDEEKGRETNKKGKDAEDLIVYVPQGTRIIDIENNEEIVDLASDGQEFLLCHGGRGCRGNYKRGYTVGPGEPEEKTVLLDYRIPNEVAILGLPNSGKTSLFNLLTGKNYKVADYPFTTASCVWGEAKLGFKSFVLLDTPPFKKTKETRQVAENIFLRHIFRSKILLFLSENRSYDDDFSVIKDEISQLEPSLLKGKKIFYLLTKVDKIEESIPKTKGIIPISVQKNIGIEELKKKIVNYLDKGSPVLKNS